ncbi:DMT family transporter [Thermoanaerobacterium sp. DL9XJH110]|uniref:DMT family transporter n=1 Tax=Thermoanaerobacterium sp. DL9XJH110 TaxID=3386643 RepID=UPI003BB6E26E
MNISPYILLALASLFWSFNFIIGKIVSAVIPPITTSFLRWFLPFVFFLPVSWKQIKTDKNLFITKWPLILLLGATGYCLNSISVYQAVRFTSTINTSFINAFNPVLIAFVGYILYHEKVTRVQFLGFVLSLAGVLSIIFQGKVGLIVSLKINPGDLFMVGSIVSWSIHTVLYKNKASGLPERPMFTLMMLGGLIITLPMVLLENIAYNWSWVGRIKIVHVLGVISLNIFPSVLAYQFWNSALKKISANKVGIFLYLIPIYTTAISIVLFGESLRLYHVLGGLLIFTGVLLVTTYGNEKNTEKVMLSQD